MSILIELLWSLILWAGGKIIVPVAIHLLEKYIPEMLTKKKKWGARERAINTLKKWQESYPTNEEIAKRGKQGWTGKDSRD